MNQLALCTKTVANAMPPYSELLKDKRHMASDVYFIYNINKCSAYVSTASDKVPWPPGKKDLLNVVRHPSDVMFYLGKGEVGVSSYNS